MRAHKAFFKPGELAERSNAADLKSVSPQGLGGSNPSLSARNACGDRGGRMNQIVGVSIALWAAASVHAQEIAPNANLRAEGIPPIPAALARQAALYTEFRPRSVVSWHPVRHELLVATRATNTTQLHHVRRPLGELTQATDYAEPVRSGLWLPAKPDVLVFARDTGGNEQGQIYRLEPG